MSKTQLLTITPTQTCSPSFPTALNESSLSPNLGDIHDFSLYPTSHPSADPAAVLSNCTQNLTHCPVSTPSCTHHQDPHNSFLVGILLPLWVPNACTQYSSQISLLKRKLSYPSSAQMLQQPPSHLYKSQKPYNDPHNLLNLVLNLWSLSTKCSPT